MMARIFIIINLLAVFICISDVHGQNPCGALSQGYILDRYSSPDPSFFARFGYKSQDSIGKDTNTRMSGEYLEVTSIEYEFLSEADSALRSKKVELFDSKNNIIRSVTYIWIEKDNDWRPRWKQTYTYDDQDRFTDGNTSVWDIEGKNWVPERKGEQIYSDTSTIYTCMAWNIEYSDWTNQCGNEWYYDESGKIMLWKRKSWDTNINEWIIWSYHELVYDESGSNVSIRYMYDSVADDYILFSKTETTGEGIYPRIEEIYHWEQITESWTLFEKYEHHYDELGNDTLYIHYRLDTLLQKLYISRKSEFEYDDKANIIQYTSISWDETGAIIYSWKENTYYSDAMEIDYKVNYTLNDTGSEWLLDYKKYYFWSDVITKVDQTTDNNILVFPNPTFSVIYLLGISDSSSYRVHSISGVLVLEGLCQKNRLDLSKLKPGSYILSFNDRNQMRFVKRIMKQ